MGREYDMLSEEEKKELLKDYDELQISVGDIIHKYDLCYSASKLYLVLPGIDSDEECDYCGSGSKMIIPRSRTITSKVMACKICGHKKSLQSNYNVKCNCDNCCREREEQWEAHIQRIYEYLDNIQRPQYSFDSLDLHDRLLLLETFEKAGDEKYNCLIGNKLNQETYKLLKSKNLISLDISSPIDAFLEDLSYYIYRVNYSVNVLNFSEIYEKYQNREYIFEDVSGKEKYRVLKELMHQDLLMKFEHLMNERGLDLIITETGSEGINVLLDKISYSQILNLMYRVAVFYLDKTQIGKIYKKNAAKGALATVVTFYNNNVKWGRSLNHSNIEYASRSLLNYIRVVLDKPITILESVICESDYN